MIESVREVPNYPIKISQPTVVPNVNQTQIVYWEVNYESYMAQMTDSRLQKKAHVLIIEL